MDTVVKFSPLAILMEHEAEELYTVMRSYPKSLWSYKQSDSHLILSTILYYYRSY